MVPRRTLVLVLLVLAACSGDVAEPEECTDPVPADRVLLEDFAFDPDCLSADAGGTVQLENVGDAPHTFTVEGTEVDVDLAADETGQASLAGVAAGTYAVTCTYHPQMVATLTVEGQ
jgi:plastocyanin